MFSQVGSALDVWARRISMEQHVSFATVHAGGFAVCAVMLFLLRFLRVIHFQNPTKVTLVALSPTAAALVLAVLGAQEAMRYGDGVVHSFSQHLIPLFAIPVDYLATGTQPSSAELIGCLLTVIAATAIHFEAYDMSFAVSAASIVNAVARTFAPMLLMVSAIRAKRLYNLTALDILFGSTVMSAAMLLPVGVILSPHLPPANIAVVLSIVVVGVATLVHRVFYMASLLHLGPLSTALAEEFSWARQLAIQVAGAASPHLDAMSGRSSSWAVIAPDTILFHSVGEVVVMVGGAGLYLAARRTRLKKMIFPSQTTSSGCNGTTPPPSASATHSSTRLLTSVALLGGGMVTASGGQWGHALLPWRFPRDQHTSLLHLLSALPLLAAGLYSVAHTRNVTGGEGRRGQRLGQAVCLASFILVALDMCCRVSVVACCIRGNNCLLCSAGIVSQIGASPSSSSWWPRRMMLELLVELLVAAAIAQGVDAPSDSPSGQPQSMPALELNATRLETLTPLTYVQLHAGL